MLTKILIGLVFFCLFEDDIIRNILERHTHDNRDGLTETCRYDVLHMLSRIVALDAAGAIYQARYDEMMTANHITGLISFLPSSLPLYTTLDQTYQNLCLVLFL